MSERFPADNDFAAIVGQLEDDASFVEAINAANDAIDARDCDDVAATDTYGTSRPYYRESITDLGECIHESFAQLCHEQGVDVNAELPTTEEYGDIGELLALLVYQMKGRIKYLDTVAATSAIVLDLRSEEDDAMGVTTIEPEERIVGSFKGPVIGPQPDEAHALLADGEAPLPIGVGLRLGDVVFVDRYGEFHEDFFTGDVIVSLGTVGLQLERFIFDTDNP